MKKLFIILIGISFINQLYCQNNYSKIDSLNSDIDILFKSIEEIHPNMYASINKEIFNKKLLSIKSQINNNTNMLDFYLLINHLMVELNDGHTGMYFPYNELKSDGVLLFPFPIEINNSRVITTGDYTKTNNLIPIGSEILSINKVPIEEIIKKMIAQISGEKEFYKLDRLKYLFTPLLYAIYRTDKFDIKYRYDELVHKKIIRGISFKERYKSRAKKNVPNNKPYSLKIDTVNDIAIIDFRQFVKLDKFKVFIDSSFNCIKNKNIANLIIDIRNNGGGDSKLGDEFFQYISKVPFKQFGKTIIKTSIPQKEFYKSAYNINDTNKLGIVVKEKGQLINLRKNRLRFNGNVYLLQSHFTFSSASSFAWAFKYFKMGKIIGEETGGLAVCFGDIIRKKLPYSDFSYTVSHKKFFLYGATDKNIHGTMPDYEVPTNKALDFTINMIKNKPCSKF